MDAALSLNHPSPIGTEPDGSARPRTTVLGAGVAGLACAVALAEAGVEVEVLEPGPGPGAGASGIAGGMLAPFCEREGAEEAVETLGAQALDWWAARHAATRRNGTLVVAPSRDAAELDRFARRTRGHAPLDAEGLAALEPDLAGRFRRGLFFAQEGHLDPRAALDSLAARLEGLGGALRYGVSGEAAKRPGLTIDCTGLAARHALPELRGVRGEMLLLRSPDVSLARSVRLLHPRIPLYVVPREGSVFMVGATMIESDDAGPPHARAVVELLNAAYALHPAFAESEILEIGAGVRPAFPDNLPAIVERGNTLYLNGFHRHGFLLAPAFAERVAARALAILGS